MNDISEENLKNEEFIKNISRDLLRQKKVDLIIGYGKGTIPTNSAPIFVRKEEDIKKLIWNNMCHANLARYLVPPLVKYVNGDKIDLKVGIVSKGCVGRALIHLAKENQVNLENIKIIGITCNGMINRRRIEKELCGKEILNISVSKDKVIVEGHDFKESYNFKDYINELCKTCQIKEPPISSSLKDIIEGSYMEKTSIEDDFKDLSDYESKNPEEKFKIIEGLLSECTRCYACREACPMCYCNLCFVDQNRPIWFGKTTEMSEIFSFHLIRAMHMAGRCVACGSCSSACPMGIDLNLINRKLEKIVKQRFDFTAGLNPDVVPPMMTQKMSDNEDFMLEEH
ncbi:MAG: 4Fe-4S dicluster domain-containing protein [Candidatus Lokiarchaeota archaeon]|nr:4Fe-4S dicluster domain-containing protein [Candidatus Lokiarchaeota archaeon]